MCKFLIPLLAVFALPNVLCAGNEKDLIVETDLGEKIIIKESATQVKRYTKDRLISMINDNTEGRYKWYEKNCIKNKDKPPRCKKDPKKNELKNNKRIKEYELKESEDLIVVTINFVPIFEDLNGMKSRMSKFEALCVNPRIQVISHDIFYNYTAKRLINWDGELTGNNLPPKKYSNLAINQVKTKLCEKYVKF